MDRAVEVPSLDRSQASYWACREEAKSAAPGPAAARPPLHAAVQRPMSPAKVSWDEVIVAHAAHPAIHSDRANSSRAVVHASHNKMDS